MPRSVPLSVRITDADAAFLARYKVEGATTPSEKLRALLAEARAQHDEAARFTDRLDRLSSLLAPALKDVRELQRENRMRSDLVMHLYERLPELLAVLMTGPRESDEPRAALCDFEDEVAEQIFTLIEDVLDLGLTDSRRTYNANQVRQRLGPVFETTALLQRNETKEGD